MRTNKTAERNSQNENVVRLSHRGFLENFKQSLWMQHQIRSLYRLPSALQNTLSQWAAAVTQTVVRLGLKWSLSVSDPSLAQKFSAADSDLGFLRKVLHSCSQLLLHNTYLDTTPWDEEGKAKQSVWVCAPSNPAPLMT